MPFLQSLERAGKAACAPGKNAFLIAVFIFQTSLALGQLFANLRKGVFNVTPFFSMQFLSTQKRRIACENICTHTFSYFAKFGGAFFRTVFINRFDVNLLPTLPAKFQHLKREQILRFHKWLVILSALYCYLSFFYIFASLLVNYKPFSFEFYELEHRAVMKTITSLPLCVLTTSLAERRSDAKPIRQPVSTRLGCVRFQNAFQFPCRSPRIVRGWRRRSGREFLPL